MRILFAAARFPDPPLSGHQVRAYHQLRLPSRRHRISLVCFRSRRPDPRADLHLAASLAAAGRKLVEQRFCREASVGQLEAVYTALCKPGG